MANSRLTLEMSRKIAERMTTDEASEPAGNVNFIRETFQLILARNPTSAETAECQTTLSELEEVLAGKADRKLRSQSALIHALINHNDFVTIR